MVKRIYYKEVFCANIDKKFEFLLKMLYNRKVVSWIVAYSKAEKLRTRKVWAPQSNDAG